MRGTIFALCLVGSIWHLNAAELPTPQAHAYDFNGLSYPYLVQTPNSISPGDPIVVYMHGAGGDEHQGMRVFKDLRRACLKRGWIFVSPAKYEFSTLRRDLYKRFGKRGIILVGASDGGRMVYWEAKRNSSAYVGLVLLGPAIVKQQVGSLKPKDLSMPIWILVGAQDGHNVRGLNRLVEQLKALERKYEYTIIPGGDHGSPVRAVDWAKVFPFIMGE